MHPLESADPAAESVDLAAPGLLGAIPPPRTVAEPAASPVPGPRTGLARVRDLLPSPASTPFAFGYALLLLATSMYTEYGDPHTVDALLQGSSTDVAHLSAAPVPTLLASALWIAGGIASPYALVFVFVLAALERRIGGWRTAGVFLLGHVVATLATELPVAVAVLAGHLPQSSLHRLDYGISFGLMATVGALTGLLTPLVRWAALGVVGVLLVQDLVELVEPLAAWGHPVALLVGVACWPAVRRVGARTATPRPAASGSAI
ncbi:rhomboid-like protein [Streptomyces sp. NBC_01431]|uniref:rhomboid-like protein n=1 Tax=Streptomyces sp. NBC_01431 TaxID=2903863 RepID=UPI002E36D30D|nr:rhomboid-like protein [Streptomyces sp. NBC_01431]